MSEEDLNTTMKDRDAGGLESDISARDVDLETPERLAALQAEAAEYKDKYLRALAELDNFKKRSLKERSDLLKYQGESIFLDILPVVDNLELALQHKDSEAEKLRTGLELIYKMFLDILGKWGVKGESSVGRPFNPEVHSALSQAPAPADTTPGTVLSELRKYYHYKDKLLRPAEVVVAAAPAEGEETPKIDGEAPKE